MEANNYKCENKDLSEINANSFCSECNKYNFGGTYDEEKCIVDGEKCKLIKCEELTKDKCDVFGYYSREVFRWIITIPT